MTSRFNKAVLKFPVISWMSKHTNVYDMGMKNVYADCPICKGKRKLGIEREKKLFHCFRCCEGQHGGAIWSGKANLLSMVRLLEHLTFADAMQKIFSMVGFPDSLVEKKQIVEAFFPEGAWELTTIPQTDPAVKYLVDRGVPQLLPYSSVCLDGPYRGRILLSAMWKDELVGYEAKSYAGRKPKSLFPDWFLTSATVYTTRRWDNNLPFCVVTESIIDAETLGINAVGLYGSNLSWAQWNCLIQLRKRGIKRLVWMLDADAWEKQVKMIFSKGQMFENYIVSMSGKEDPNLLGCSECWQRVSDSDLVSDEFELLGKIITR